MTHNDANLANFFRDATNLDETLDDYLKYCHSRAEVREALHHLIEYRELLRDSEIARLQADSESLLERLQEIGREELLAEIQSFKDILSLYRRLLQENGHD